MMYFQLAKKYSLKNVYFLRFSFLACLTFQLFFTFAQNAPPNPPGGSFVYSENKLLEVDFDKGFNDPPNSKISILRDFSPFESYKTKAWKTNNNVTPIAFLSGSRPIVSALFETCSNIRWAKGVCSNGVNLIPSLLQNGKYSEQMPNKFANNVIEFFEKFEIEWFLSSSQNGPWISVGKSYNPLYIIYSDVEVLNVKYYHSLLYYSCKNGRGQNSIPDKINSIYNLTFKNKSVKRIDNPKKDKMSYWGNDNPQDDGSCWGTNFLLDYEDGRCGAWANFFKDMIDIHGFKMNNKPVQLDINAIFVKNESGINIPQFEFLAPMSDSQLEDFTNDIISTFGNLSNCPQLMLEPIFVDLNNNEMLDAGESIFILEFYVNNWNFKPSEKFYLFDNEHPKLKLHTQENSFQTCNNTTINYGPKSGAESQGNMDPQSVFKDHAVVKFGSNIYDPSYGIDIVTSENTYETNNLAGFGCHQISYYVNPNSKQQLMWKIENNSSQQTVFLKK